MSGIKHDSEKPDMSLLSSIAMFKIAQIMSFGKRKYSANNWRGGIAYTRLIAAALRHIFSWLGGESVDPESGQSHLAHASCCLMMLLEFESTRPDLDDRYKASVPAQTEAEKVADKIINGLSAGAKVTITDKASSVAAPASGPSNELDKQFPIVAEPGQLEFELEYGGTYMTNNIEFTERDSLPKVCPVVEKAKRYNFGEQS
jgi:hypothetical protein